MQLLLKAEHDCIRAETEARRNESIKQETAQQVKPLNFESAACIDAALEASKNESNTRFKIMEDESKAKLVVTMSGSLCCVRRDGAAHLGTSGMVDGDAVAVAVTVGANNPTTSGQKTDETSEDKGTAAAAVAYLKKRVREYEAARERVMLDSLNLAAMCAAAAEKRQAESERERSLQARNTDVKTCKEPVNSKVKILHVANRNSVCKIEQ